ncbi:MAG TPA: uroporphyrinogen decarboxylase family protein, partial [Thermoanaerobaculia bacterium]|nr:uroporphyrinogen decarboxylase family protein [Thermoanaerobaculia bacterium]
GELGRGLLAAGADAILISSAFAGGGFISPAHYEEFVLPFEAEVIRRIRDASPRAIVYVHTCGAIGDRLELMQRSGTDGIDTLDPPPLGTCDLADARRRLAPSVFIKGNVDPVNTVLRGTADQCRRDALERIAIAGPAGYILSTACSVPPHAPPENVLAISEAAREGVIA